MVGGVATRNCQGVVNSLQIFLVLLGMGASPGRGREASIVPCTLRRGIMREEQEDEEPGYYGGGVRRRIQQMMRRRRGRR